METSKKWDNNQQIGTMEIANLDKILFGVHSIFLEFIFSALAKKWLFWFCEALASVSGKTKCATSAAG